MLVCFISRPVAIIVTQRQYWTVWIKVNSHCVFGPTVWISNQLLIPQPKAWNGLIFHRVQLIYVNSYRSFMIIDWVRPLVWTHLINFASIVNDNRFAQVAVWIHYTSLTLLQRYMASIMWRQTYGNRFSNGRCSTALWEIQYTSRSHI